MSDEQTGGAVAENPDDQPSADFLAMAQNGPVTAPGSDPTMRGGGVMRAWNEPTPEQVQQARRERLEFFAQQIYITAAQRGELRDAVQCARDAKALYAELDRKSDGEGGHEE